MKPRTKTALGIDVGEHHISVAVVERSERGFRTIAAATDDLPARGAGRRFGYARVLSRLLRRLGPRARLRELRAVMAVSAHPMVMQLLDVPRHMPANLNEFVGQELRQYVALSGKEILSDYCGVGIASGPHRRLLAVATDATRVRVIVKACGMSGTAVEAAEPAVLAYARALLGHEGQAGYKHDMMMAVLGCHSLTMCLFSKGALDFVRVRDLPGDAVSVDFLSKWLAEELRAVMQYRDTQPLRSDRDRQVKLIVHEAPHPLQEIQRHLTAETGMDSVAVVGPCDCLADQAGAGPNASSHTPSAAALGAALRLLQAQGEDPRVNLVPAEVAQARRFLRRVLIAANVAALIFLGVLLVVQYLSRATDVMHQKLDQTRVSRQLHTMPALIAQEEFLDREISRIGQELGRLQVVRARHAVDWPRVLERARRAAPAEVSITHVGCSDGRSLSVRGFAPSSESARQFVRSLEDGGPFEAVSLARLERQPDSGDPLEYQIDCLLKATR